MAEHIQPGRDDDDRLLAAEIALGLVDARLHADRLRSDPALAAAVGRWQADLAPLIDEIAPVAPAPGLWLAIRARVRAEAAPARPRAGRAFRLGRLPPWPMLPAAGMALAAALGLVLLLWRPEDAGRPAPDRPVAAQLLLVASLLPRDGPPLFVATVDLATRTVVVVPVGGTALPGGSPRLWLVPPGDADPIAIGMLAPARPTRILLGPEIVADTVAAASLVVTLEASAETAGVTPGPVVAHGVFVVP